MTVGELAIVIEGRREDWPGGARTLTPRVPTREPNGTFWFGARARPRRRPGLRVAGEAIGRMPEKNALGPRPARGRRPSSSVITPDRQLAPGLNRFEIGRLTALLGASDGLLGLPMDGRRGWSAQSLIAKLPEQVGSANRLLPRAASPAPAAPASGRPGPVEDPAATARGGDCAIIGPAIQEALPWLWVPACCKTNVLVRSRDARVSSGREPRNT